MSEPETVKRGQTIVLTGSFTDKDDALADPSVSKLIRIADPDNTLQVTDSAMATDGATGKWKYTHQVGASDKEGEWTFEVIGKDGATPDVSIGEGSFVVEVRIGS